MRKQYIRWILPIIALIIIATVIVLSPLVSSHAAGLTPTVTPTPTTTPSHKVQPNNYWYY